MSSNPDGPYVTIVKHDCDEKTQQREINLTCLELSTGYDTSMNTKFIRHMTGKMVDSLRSDREGVGP